MWMQVGMISESIRTIARGFQLNPQDALAVVSLLEVIARERSAAVAEGINITAVVSAAQQLSQQGDIRATKALAELYNSVGHYAHARDLLASVLATYNNSKQIDQKKSNVDPHWSAKCLLMNLAHAGQNLPPLLALLVPCSNFFCSCGLGHPRTQRSGVGAAATAG
jgi:hypothetical protein